MQHSANNWTAPHVTLMCRLKNLSPPADWLVSNFRRNSACSDLCRSVLSRIFDLSFLFCPWTSRRHRRVMVKGCLIPYTPIAVDYFRKSRRRCSRARVFFLSHVQLHQSCGLSSSWALPIYCSHVSKKLLLHLFQASISPNDALCVSSERSLRLQDD